MILKQVRELYVGAYHNYVYDPDDVSKCHHAIHDQETGALIVRYGVHGVSVMSHNGVRGSSKRDNFGDPAKGVGSCAVPHTGYESRQQVTVTRWLESAV